MFLHRFFCSCGKSGPTLQLDIHGLLIVVISHVDHGLWGMWAPVIVTCGLSHCGPQVLTPEPPGKPWALFCKHLTLSTPYHLTPVLNYTFMLFAQPLGAFEFVMHDPHI